MRDQFIRTLSEQAEVNQNIMLLTGDLGFGVLNDFAARFPDQYLNVGVAEQNMAGLAAGLALEGKVVFTYSIANFPTLRCLEQIRNDICYHGANVKIVAIGGGFSYGALGMSHHATEDLAILRAFPMTIISPCDLYETQEATKAIINHQGACYLRIDKSVTNTESAFRSEFKIGKARKLRSGKDCCLISIGGVTQEALDAAKTLAAEGVECSVVSLHTLKPIDKDMIAQVCKESQGIITIEEHTIDGGLGGAVAEVILENSLKTGFFHRIGLRAGFSSIVGSQQYLRKYYNIDADTICSTVKDLCRIPVREVV